MHLFTVFYFIFLQKKYDMKHLPQTAFFINVHRLIKMKIHLHYSHVTCKTLGYAHDFCNTKVTEKGEPDIPVIAHNVFRFDLYYFIKGYIAFIWCSK